MGTKRKYRNSITSSSSKDSAGTPVPHFAESTADVTFFSSLPPLGLLPLTWGRVVVSVNSAPSETKGCSSTRGLRLARFSGIRLSRGRSPGSSGLEDWPANEQESGCCFWELASWLSDFLEAFQKSMPTRFLLTLASSESWDSTGLCEPGMTPPTKELKAVVTCCSTSICLNRSAYRKTKRELNKENMVLRYISSHLKNFKFHSNMHQLSGIHYTAFIRKWIDNISLRCRTIKCHRLWQHLQNELDCFLIKLSSAHFWHLDSLCLFGSAEPPGRPGCWCLGPGTDD